MNFPQLRLTFDPLRRRLGSAAATLGFKRPGSIVPRRACTYLTFDLAKVPRRYAISAIVLQLQQTALFKQAGFAFRLQDGKAGVWAWEEAASAGEPVGANPLPEPLLRLPDQDGFPLLRCSEGFEARWIDAGQLRKTRWYSALPTEEEWRDFCRDAGHEAVPMTVVSTPLLSELPAGWTVHTSKSTQWSKGRWIAIYGAIAVSCVFVAQIAAWYKVEQGLATATRTLEGLRARHAELIGQQKAVEETAAYVSSLNGLLPERSQQELFDELSAVGIARRDAGAQLRSWKYQGGQVAMGFVLTDSALSQSAFLAKFADLKSYSNVRLPPQTTVGEFMVQAEIASNSRVVAATPVRAGQEQTP